MPIVQPCVLCTLITGHGQLVLLQQLIHEQLYSYILML